MSVRTAASLSFGKDPERRFPADHIDDIETLDHLLSVVGQNREYGSVSPIPEDPA
jgi:hypothetical protein